MTKSTDDLTAAMIATNARRLAQIEADRARFANPIIPAPSGRAPRRRSRRTSVPHRSIR